MKKKFKIFFAGFAVFVVVLALLPFLLPQSTYKSWFVTQVESALPLHLEVGKFQLRLLPLPTVELREIKVYSKLKPFEKERMAEAKVISASVSLRALLSRQVVVGLKLKSPILYPNFQDGIPQENKGSPAPSRWKLKIASLVLEDGIIKASRYEVKNIDASLAELSFAGRSQIPFSLSFEPLGDQRLFSLKGDFYLDADLEKLITKNLKIRFDDFDGRGTLACNLKTFFTSGKIAAEAFTYKEYPLKNVEMDFAFNPPRLEIPNLSADLFEAKAKGKGTLLFAKPISYQLDINLDGVQLAQLAFLKKQIVGKGSLSASLSGKVVEGRDPSKDLNATGNIQVTEGEIPSLKLGEEIFDNAVWDILTPLAGFNKAALNSLKGLDAKVERFSIPFEVHNGVAKILNGKWEHPRYQIGLKGEVSLNQQLSGEGAFILPENELNQLVEEPAVRRALADSQGRLLLPFHVGGTLSYPRVEPDKKYLTPRFTKAVALRGVESIKRGVESIFNPPQKEGEAKSLPVKVLEGIFGR